MTENVIRNGGDSGVSDGDDNDKQQRRRRRVRKRTTRPRSHAPFLALTSAPAPRNQTPVGGAPNFGLSLVVQRTIRVWVYLYLFPMGNRQVQV